MASKKGGLGKGFNSLFLENSVEELSDTSVVFCSLPVGNGQNAVLGILGPKRMDYKKVIPTIKYIGDILQEKINKERGGNKTDGKEGKE